MARSSACLTRTVGPLGSWELDRHYQKHPNLFDQLHHKRQGGLLACGDNREIWLPLLLVVDIICPLFSETRRSQVLKSDVQHRLSSLALYFYEQHVERTQAQCQPIGFCRAFGRPPPPLLEIFYASRDHFSSAVPWACMGFRIAFVLLESNQERNESIVDGSVLRESRRNNFQN